VINVKTNANIGDKGDRAITTPACFGRVFRARDSGAQPIPIPLEPEWIRTLPIAS
jgi:hypothetical protein